MFKPYLCILMACCICLLACQDNSRSDALDKREAAIAERERAQSALSEDYQQLLLMREELNNQKLIERDSLREATSWTDSLVGEWESKLVCIATSCRGYVIGDQRTEQWTFYSDTTGFQLQIAGKTMQPKTFWAAASENRNELLLHEQSSQGRTHSTTKLTFSEIADKRIRGQKQNTGSDNCKLVFSVLLTPRSK